MDNEHTEKILKLLRLKCLCRIRGLSVDLENNKDDLIAHKFFCGATKEYEELLRHLSELKYIVADIDCAEKYLNDGEKMTFHKLKKDLGFEE